MERNVMKKSKYGIVYKKEFRKGTAFAVLLLLLAALLFTGWRPDSTIYAQTPHKQGVIVIPVDFGQSLNGGGRPSAASFGGRTTEPEVKLKYGVSINLNDLYNSRAKENISLNQFVSKATYRMNFITPIYVGTLFDFTPFNLMDYKLDDVVNASGTGIDHAKMTVFLSSIINEINTMPQVADRLGASIGSVYSDAAKQDEEVQIDISSKNRIDHVVFLVNASDHSSYSTDRLRSYYVGGNVDPKYQITAPLSVTYKQKRTKWVINIQEYEVIFIGEDLREALIHETMHAKGVKDLYLEPKPGKMEYPAGNWDVQSVDKFFSGPYFTQRLQMYSLEDKLTRAAVQMDVNLQKETAISQRVKIKDINSSAPVNVAADVTVNHPQWYYESPNVVWTGKNGRQHYWIEYRRPETDNYARALGASAKDGALLFYTDFLEPCGGGVYLLEEKLLNGDKQADGTYRGSVARTVCVNSNVRRGFLRPADNEKLRDGTSYRLDWTFSNIKTETEAVTAAAVSGTVNEYSVSFDLKIQPKKINSGDVFMEPVSW